MNFTKSIAAICVGILTTSASAILLAEDNSNLLEILSIATNKKMGEGPVVVFVNSSTNSGPDSFAISEPHFIRPEKIVIVGKSDIRAYSLTLKPDFGTSLLADSNLASQDKPCVSETVQIANIETRNIIATLSAELTAIWGVGPMVKYGLVLSPNQIVSDPSKVSMATPISFDSEALKTWGLSRIASEVMSLRELSVKAIKEDRPLVAKIQREIWRHNWPMTQEILKNMDEYGRIRHRDRITPLGSDEKVLSNAELDKAMNEIVQFGFDWVGYSGDSGLKHGDLLIEQNEIQKLISKALDGEVKNKVKKELMADEGYKAIKAQFDEVYNASLSPEEERAATEKFTSYSFIQNLREHSDMIKLLPVESTSLLQE